MVQKGNVLLFLISNQSFYYATINRNCINIFLFKESAGATKALKYDDRWRTVIR